MYTLPQKYPRKQRLVALYLTLRIFQKSKANFLNSLTTSDESDSPVS